MNPSFGDEVVPLKCWGSDQLHPENEDIEVAGGQLMRLFHAPISSDAFVSRLCTQTTEQHAYHQDQMP